MKGAALPYCSYFSFTAIDDHRALIFGGRSINGRTDHLYLIDFDTMVSILYTYLHWMVPKLIHTCTNTIHGWIWEEKGIAIL